MSALEGARVRAMVLNPDQTAEHKFLDVEGVVVSVAAGPSSSGFPLPESWKCLVLIDGAAAGEGALRVVDANNLIVLSVPALTPALTAEGAGEALTKASAKLQSQQLEIVKLEDEAAGLAAEVAALKKKLAAKKPKADAQCHGCSHSRADHPNDSGCQVWHDSHGQ